MIEAGAGALSETLYLILYRKPKGDWQAKSHIFSSENLAKAMIKWGMPKVKPENKRVVIISAEQLNLEGRYSEQ